jgi:thiol-disulfide isomerase/thioredoxin
MTKRIKCLKFLVTGMIATSVGLYVGMRMSNQAPSQAPSAVDTSVRLLFQQTLPDSTQKMHALAEWRGKILILNFWATWCVPCVEEMPELAALQRQLKGKNIQFVGIGIDSHDKIAEFLSKNKNIDYPLLVAGAAGLELSRSLGNAAGGLPYTVVIDQQGQIQHVKSGRIEQQVLSNWLTELLGRP